MLIAAGVGVPAAVRCAWWLGANGGRIDMDGAGESRCGAFRLRFWELSSGPVGFRIDAMPANLEAGEKLPPGTLGARGRGGSSIVLPFP